MPSPASRSRPAAPWPGSPARSPVARWWFVGAGAASVTHDTVLTVDNPRPGPAVIDIDVYGPAGQVAAPGLHGLTLGPGATRVFDLSRLAPSVGDLAVSVLAQRGLVAVSAADTYSPGAARTRLQEWLPPQSAPSRTVTLSGLPAKPRDARLIVVNPTGVEVIAKLEVLGATGTFTPTTGSALTIGPASVVSVPVTGVFDGKALAIRVSAPRPVTATVRVTGKRDIAFASGVVPIRGSTAFAVPDVPSGSRLVLSSPGSPSTVQVSGFTARGRPVHREPLTVAAGASLAADLPRRVRYVRLVTDRPVLAGFSVTASSGLAAAGVAPAIRAVRLPVVRPAW